MTARHQRGSRLRGRRAGVGVVWLAGVMAAILLWKQAHPPEQKFASLPAPVAVSAEQILAAMPTVQGKSAEGKALAGALVKARETPNAARAWIDLGDALAEKLRDSENPKDYDVAEQVYWRALALDPKSVEAMIGMAWVEGGRRHFEPSIAWANRALALAPANLAASEIIGDATLELGDYARASAEYQKLLKERPDPDSWSRNARLLWLKGDLSKALRLMQKALAARLPESEKTARDRARLAVMLFQNGAFLPAEQVLAPALDAAPRNPGVLLAAGRLAAARRDFSAAERFYQTVLAVGSSQEALVSLGDIQTVKGQREKAEAFYKKVEALPVRDGHAQMLRAKFYADHDRHLAEALRLAEQHKLSNNVLEADTVAWVYLKNGNLPEARAAMKRALRLDTPDAEFRYHAGMIAVASGEPGVAQRDLGKALSLNPKFSVLQSPIAVRTLEQVAGRAAAGAEPAPLAAKP